MKTGSEKTISQKFIDQLYNVDAVFKDPEGNRVEVRESGFLGLLATGYKGLAAWRKAKGETHLYNRYTKGKKLVRRKQK